MGKFMCQSENEAMSAATVKTGVQYVAPSSGPVRVRAWGVSLDGVTAANVPGDVELLRQTTAGTASALTPADWEEGARTALGTAQKSFTVEPTAGNVLHPVQLTPNGGVYECWYGDDGPKIPASGRVGIRGNFANVVNASFWMLVEEL